MLPVCVSGGVMRLAIIAWSRALAALVLAIGASAAWAAADVHLQFHMVAGNGQRFFIGGTLANTGDAPVGHGYLVATLIDDRCRVSGSVLQAFGPLAAGQSSQFRIPLSVTGLHHYRLAVKAFDEQGFAVPAVDDNQAVLDGRLDAERIYCKTFM